MKSRRAITTMCQLFVLASSTLLEKCLSATCSPDYLTATPYRCRPHERPGSSGQTRLVASTSHNVRFAPSLATRVDAGQPHLLTYICPLKWVDGKSACTLLAGTQDKASRDSTYDVTLAERRASAYLSSRKTTNHVHVDNIFLSLLHNHLPTLGLFWF
jgi:hypothetical protein